MAQEFDDSNWWQRRATWQKATLIAVGALVGIALFTGGEDDPEIIAASGDEQTSSPTATSTPEISTTETRPGSTTSTSPSTTTPPSTTTVATSTTTTNVATTTTTTTTSPTTTTTTQPERTFEVFATEGTGDDVIDFSIPNDEAAVLRIDHRGASNFAIVSYTSSGERLDLLVNTIGDYSGTVPGNLYDGETIAEFEITADGPWSIEASPLLDAEDFSDSVTGSGDDVLLNRSDSSRLTISHAGESNFVVLSHGSRRELLVNEIGAYDGTVRIDPGSLVLEINADGEWSIDGG